jgi:hypothetical protein
MTNEMKIRIMRIAGFFGIFTCVAAIYHGHGWGVFPGAITGYLAGTLRALDVIDETEKSN